MTIEKCKDHCASYGGYKFYGIWSRTYCGCGRADYIPKIGKVHDALCNYKCLNDEDEDFCGGASLMSLYDVSGNDWFSLGMENVRVDERQAWKNETVLIYQNALNGLHGLLSLAQFRAVKVVFRHGNDTVKDGVYAQEMMKKNLSLVLTCLKSAEVILAASVGRRMNYHSLSSPIIK
jgi:hypothetical protein